MNMPCSDLLATLRDLPLTGKDVRLRPTQDMFVSNGRVGCATGDVKALAAHLVPDLPPER